MKIHSAKELGSMVRSLRLQRHWTQADLAARAGVSPLWISQLERGKSTARLGLVLRTLRELEVTLSVAEETTSGGTEGAAAPIVNLDDIVKGGA